MKAGAWGIAPRRRGLRASRRPQWSLVTALIVISASLDHAWVFGQVTGTVTTPDGAPLEGVVAEIWDFQSRRGITVTNQDGHFVLPLIPGNGLVRVVLTSPGHVTHWETVSEHVAALRVILHPVSAVLSPIVVAAAREPCPGADEPLARELWDAARERYSNLLSERPIEFSFLRAEEALVTATRIGLASPEAFSPGSAHYVGTSVERTPGRHTNIDVDITTQGYAFPTGMQLPRWRFPQLEGRHAYHFASSTFGRLNNLSLVGESQGEWLIAFCSRNSRGVRVQGTLTLAPDKSLTSASWTFVEGRTEEIAGGDVIFFPRAADQSPLIPARGVFWERHWRWADRYNQRITVFLDWRFGSG
jgi:hypothetical protein